MLIGRDLVPHPGEEVSPVWRSWRWVNVTVWLALVEVPSQAGRDHEVPPTWVDKSPRALFLFFKPSLGPVSVLSQHLGGGRIPTSAFTLSKMEGAVGYDSVHVSTHRKFLRMHTAVCPHFPMIHRVFWHFQAVPLLLIKKSGFKCR